MLLSLFRRKPSQVRVGGVADALFVHMNGLLTGRPRRRFRDLLLRLAQRQPRNVILRARTWSFITRRVALHSNIVVVLSRWILGRVIVFCVGGLGLVDLHGGGALLLGEVEVGFVPLEALGGLVGVGGVVS